STSNPVEETAGQKEKATEEPEATPLNALLYYRYDNVIWGYAPNGIMQPLGVGTHPTASLNGKLTYQDVEGNVIVLDSDNPSGKLLVGMRELATEPAISPDGGYLAFARRSVDRRRIYIRHLSSQQEILVPSTAKEMFTPTWNLSGELLAYGTKGSIENPEAGEDRNIYAYDRVSGRVEPICIGPADDAEPAWSPSNPNLLAFSRAEGRHRQIWTVEISPAGKPREQQLTRYGGEKPVWLPDGSAILYENNGQLWLISKDGSENRPVLVKGKILLGHEPYVIPSPLP
ncbi:PD40 domain-containing protein, partial [Candidatus Poribacteria bacterium]|nr:PD40 domain-containing protein [Candidatus Poribacteria bacterium]